MREAPFFPIPSDQLAGVIAVNVVAALANLALIPVGIRVAWLAIRRPWSKSLSEPSEYVFFHTQLGQYVTCFIVAMLFNTISGILGFPWTFMRGIQDGPLCRAQALFMAIGTFSGGFFTIAIAVHTFGALVLKKRQSAVICRSTICVGWGLSFLTAAVPFAIHSSEGSVYGPDHFVCGIRSIFPKLQFLFHLLPILLASLFGIVLYSLVFLALRGTVKVRKGVKLTLNPTKRWAEREKTEFYHQFVVRLSRSMLWYPVAYIVFLVPYSMLRLFAISGFAVPFEAMVFAFVCFYLLNVVEVPLLYNTFRLLGRAFDGVSTRNTQREADSFFSSDLRHADIEDRQLVGSFSQLLTPSTFASHDISDKTSEHSHSNRSSFVPTFQTFLEADVATAMIPTSMARLGYREETTNLAVIPSSQTLTDFSSLELSPRTSQPTVADSRATRPRPPRTPPRSRASPPIPPHSLIRQTSLTVQEGRWASPLTTPDPTYKDPFKSY